MAALNRLRNWQYYALYMVMAALLLTGLAWLPMHYLWGAGAEQLPHPAEPMLMRLHGLFAFAGLFVAGVLGAAHIPHGWHMTTHNPRLRERWSMQRSTGIVMCSLGLLCVLTAYCLYYFAPENLRPALGWFHTALGLALAVLLPWHGWRRRSR